MFNIAKYIRTSENNIIIFPCTIEHNKFSIFNPVSAGFIKIHINVTDNNIDISCDCYGESTSLGLKSDEIIDSKLAYVELIKTSEL